ncbi:MAG: hypothetical protein APF77_21105 [Clostridia bacterium BRH_c25]|nr:MAG: hypothetical protein APF77_21105 [Clostridia bacterium BRH_c25]
MVLPLNFEMLIPENDSVRLLSHILEGKAYSSNGRKPAVEPKILYKVLTYAYMNNIYSSRKIETACRRDINFMWLLQGRLAPDHSTIARFRKDFLIWRKYDRKSKLILFMELGNGSQSCRSR